MATIPLTSVLDRRTFSRMGTPRYLWRQLTPKQRTELLAWRKKHERPWHSPPHARIL